MKQVKFFLENSYNEVAIEKKVNNFLAANDQTIDVIDVKLQVTALHPDRNEWQIYTVALIYDVPSKQDNDQDESK